MCVQLFWKLTLKLIILFTTNVYNDRKFSHWTLPFVSNFTFSTYSACLVSKRDENRYPHFALGARPKYKPFRSTSKRVLPRVLQFGKLSMYRLVTLPQIAHCEGRSEGKKRPARTRAKKTGSWRGARAAVCYAIGCRHAHSVPATVHKNSRGMNKPRSR